jgi:pSer/pThr/pTyr-binding forkhead associated (FHA) protein
VLGRHDTCQVVLDDALVSRRHALLSFDGTRVTIEDLGSVNGVLLNARRIRSAEVVKNGDQVKLGNQPITVCLGEALEARPGRNRAGAQTLARTTLADRRPDEEESTVVREGEALETLVLVVEKVLAMGRGSEAERILRKSLDSLLLHVRAGEFPEAETLEVGALYALRIAEAVQKAEWVDYVVALYDARGQLFPASIVERLYAVVRLVGGLNLEALRGYIAHQQARTAVLGPAERFLLRRVEGLEQLAGLR